MWQYSSFATGGCRDWIAGRQLAAASSTVRPEDDSRINRCRSAGAAFRLVCVAGAPDASCYSSGAAGAGSYRATNVHRES